MRVQSDTQGAVWVVVVTYNRRQLLKGCLDAIANQSHSLSGIVLVDNASDDGTGGFLVEEDVISGITPENLSKAGVYQASMVASATLNRNIPVEYVRLPLNAGGAGGFREGVSHAIQRGADWLWLLDDDVEPELDCLSRLLAWSDHSSCLHPRRRLPDGSYYHWEAYVDILSGNDVFLDDISFRNGKEICFVNLGCFEGMLINRDIVKQIGFPDKRFFIVYDDTMYGLLASIHTNVAYVKDAEIRKMLPLPCEMFTDRFIYYSMRNYFLRLEYLDQLFPRLLYRLARKVNIIMIFIRYFFYILLKKRRKISAMSCLFKGLFDGMRGRFGCENI